MSGNEEWLVPELFSFMFGKIPTTRVYLNAERFAGAKRGGSPNLAKLACACRIMHKANDLKPKLQSLDFPDPVDEFLEWMDYELDNGFMWNEQGPSPNYDWMHLLPQITLAEQIGHRVDLAVDWLRMFFKVLKLGRTKEGIILQAGMRGVGHLPSVGFNEWMVEFLETSKQKNKFYKKHLEKNGMYHVVCKCFSLLLSAYHMEPERAWKVRVPQHWYTFEKGKMVLVSHDGNGNTQARAADIKIEGEERAIFPRDGGDRKQGDLDEMACSYDGGRAAVLYTSARFSPKQDSYSCKRAGKLLHVHHWDEHGLRREDTGSSDGGQVEPGVPPELYPDAENPKPTHNPSPRKSLLSRIWDIIRGWFTH